MYIIEFNYLKIKETFNEGSGYIDYNSYYCILDLAIAYPELINNFVKEALEKFRSKVQYRLSPNEDKFLDELLNVNPE